MDNPAEVQARQLALVGAPLGPRPGDVVPVAELQGFGIEGSMLVLTYCRKSDLVLQAEHLAIPIDTFDALFAQVILHRQAMRGFVSGVAQPERGGKHAPGESGHSQRTA